MRVLVIGGNAAGMSAASRLVRKGGDVDVVVFEMTREVSYGACGLPYYIADLNPDLNKVRIRSVEEFEKSGVTVHLEHEVLTVNPDKRCITVRDLTTGACRDEQYDKLIISSGALPIIPPIPGTDLPGVFTLKTPSDAERIKKTLERSDVRNVAIIGGGYIGLELAEACVLQRKDLHIFEAMPHLLNGFDEEFRRAVEKELVAHGVAVHTNETVEKISGDGRVQSVMSAGKTYRADMVIIAIGVHPNTSFIDGSLIKKEGNGALTTDGRHADIGIGYLRRRRLQHGDAQDIKAARVYSARHKRKQTGASLGRRGPGEAGPV